MYVKLLLYIKHNLKFLWESIDFFNCIVFKFAHLDRTKKLIPEIIKKYTLKGYLFRQLTKSDIGLLKELIDRQDSCRLQYFNPHGFETKDLLTKLENPSFIMLGAFKDNLMVGYFFLRCFWNRKCFVGRLIDEAYVGRGIGNVMNLIMYNIAWGMGFRCLSTISRDNAFVIKAHSGNPNIVLLKELENNYLLVEFVREPQRPIHSVVDGM